VIRLACLLVLIALSIAFVLAMNPTGPNAVLFSFVGMPTLAAGILVFGVKRWRDGALSWNRDST
jgi:NADH:ubiquinone oxidoreductase subunit 3 (subunit A)